VKFWTFAFRDGIHLNGLFKGMQLVRMYTSAWDISGNDRISRKELQFLVMMINSLRGPNDLESVSGKDRCFRHLFGKPCNVCM
jgi:hypothetical protein